MFSINTNKSSPHTKLVSESNCVTENASNENDLKSQLNNSVSSNDKLNIIAENKISDLHEKCRSKIELANTLCRKNLLSLYKDPQIECSKIDHEKDSMQHLEFVVHDESDEDDKSDLSNEFDDESDAKTNSITTNDSQLCCMKNKTIHHCEITKNLFYSSHNMSNRGNRSGDKAMREWYVRYKVRSLGMQLMSGCLGAASSNDSSRKPSLMDICNNLDDPVECRFNLIIDHVQDTLTQLQKICDGDYLSEHVKRKWNTTRHSCTSSRNKYFSTGNIVKNFSLTTVKPKFKKQFVFDASKAYKNILQATILLQSLNIKVNPQRQLAQFSQLRRENIIFFDSHCLHDSLNLAREKAIMIGKEPSPENNLDVIMKKLKKPKLLAITWSHEKNPINKPKEECLDATLEILPMEKNLLDLSDNKIINSTNFDNILIEDLDQEINYPEMEIGKEFNLNEVPVMLKDSSGDEGITDIADIDEHVMENFAQEKKNDNDIKCKIIEKSVVTNVINRKKSDVMNIEENFGAQTIDDTKNVKMFNDNFGIGQVTEEIDLVIDSTLHNHQTMIFAEQLSAIRSDKHASANSSITSSFMEFLTKIQLNNVDNFDNILSNSGLDNLKVTMKKLSMQSALPETINEENNDITTNDKQKPNENNTNEEDTEKSRSEKRLKQIKEKRKKRKLDSVENQKEIYRVVRRGEGYNPLCTSTSVTRLSISNKSFYNSIYGSNITKRIRNISSKKDDVKPIKIQSQMSKHFSSKEFDKKKNSFDLNTNVKDAASSLKRHKMKRRKVNNAIPKVVHPSKYAAIPYTLQCGEPGNYVMEQCSSYNSNDNGSNSDGSEEIEVPSNSENIISMYNIESDNTSNHSSVTSITNKFKIKDKRTNMLSDLDIGKQNFSKSIDSEKPIVIKSKCRIDEKTKSKSQSKCKKTIHKVYDLMKQIDKTFQPTKPVSKQFMQNETRSKCIKTNTDDNDARNNDLDDKMNTLCGRKSAHSKEEYISTVPKVFINAKKKSANTIPSNITVASDMGIDKFEKVVRRFSSQMRRNENKIINKKEDRDVVTMDLFPKSTLESKHLLENDMKQEKHKFRQMFGNLHKIICSPSLNTVHESNEESGSVGKKKKPVHRCAQTEKNLSQIRRQISELRDEVKEAYGEAVRGPTLDRIDFLSQPKKKHTNDKKIITNKKVSSNFPITGKIESIQTGVHRLGNRSNDSRNHLDIQAKNSVTGSSNTMKMITQRPVHRPQTSPRSTQDSKDQKVRKNHDHEVSRHFQGRKKITQSCPSIPRNSTTQCFDDPKVKIIHASTPARNCASIKLNSANKKIEEIFKYVSELKPIIEKSKSKYKCNEDEDIKDCSMTTLEVERPANNDTLRLLNTEHCVVMLDSEHMLQEKLAKDYNNRNIFDSGNGDSDISSNPNNLVVNELISHNYLIPFNEKEIIAESSLNVGYVMPNRIYNFSHDCNNSLISSLLSQLEDAFSDNIKKNTVYTNKLHIPKTICTAHSFSLADLSVLQGGDASSIFRLSKRNAPSHQKINYFVHNYCNMLVVPDCVINVAYSTDNNVASGSKSNYNVMRIEYVLSYETTVVHYTDEFMMCYHMERIAEITPMQLCANKMYKLVCVSNVYHCHAKYSCEVFHLRQQYERIIVFEMISLPRNEYLQLCDSYSTYSVYLSSDGSVEIQNINLQDSSHSDIASASPSSTTTGVSVICRLPNHTINNLGTSVHNVLRSELCKETYLEDIIDKKNVIDIFHNGKCGRKRRLGSSKMYRLKFENSCCYRAVREYKNRVSRKSNSKLVLFPSTKGTNTSYTNLTSSTKLKKGVLISFYVTLISTVFALLVIPDVINQETLCEPTDLNISQYNV